MLERHLLEIDTSLTYAAHNVNILWYIIMVYVHFFFNSFAQMGRGQSEK